MDRVIAHGSVAVAIVRRCRPQGAFWLASSAGIKHIVASLHSCLWESGNGRGNQLTRSDEKTADTADSAAAAPPRTRRNN